MPELPSWCAMRATIASIPVMLSCNALPPAPAPVPEPVMIAPSAAHPPLAAREIARRASGYTVFLRSGRGYGAGVVFDRSGHVLTCDHVLLEPERLEVYFEGRPEPLAATVVDRDPALDLALLALETPLPAEVTPAAEHGLDSVAGLERGDEVYAMGAPRKMRFSFDRGIVSFDGRPFEQLLYVQTDLAMSPGSSGGPVLNDRGQLVGIASFILRGGEGLSFALPIEYALRRFPPLDGVPSEARRERLAAFESWLHAHAGRPRRGAERAAEGGAPMSAR